MLFDVNTCAERASSRLLQRPSCAISQMMLIRRQQRRPAGRQQDRNVIRQSQGDFIAERDALHQHVHQVIAILTLTGDVERPVDFRARKQVQRRHEHRLHEIAAFIIRQRE